ncbi:hypothetical protein [Kordiimonas pumila]|uniref:Uncharacterized protein n=1 Tax=Kordiimonas pumila TaxID=2161677 RepID=A0ABV7D0C7_9PROT|nr:hypothetical protein [Kordiimonas pumila]
MLGLGKNIINTGAAFLIATAVTGSALAEHRYERPATINFQDADFRAAHPFRVFIDINTREGDAALYADKTLKQLSYSLPGTVILVNNPLYADMVIGVTQTSYDLGFRVTDTDQKDKKYKNARSNGADKCGPYQKAYYTKVEEKGEAYAGYNISFDMRGYGADITSINLRSAENFSYGTNLRASTKCGIQPVSAFPNNDVAKIFQRADPAYRDSVAAEIRAEAAHDLGRNLAVQIKGRSEQFYAMLAANLSAPRYTSVYYLQNWGQPAVSYDNGFYDENGVFPRVPRENHGR